MKGTILDETALVMSETDTVATALSDLTQGTNIVDDDANIRLSEDVPFGHKLALVSIDSGDPIHKYGEVIGTASEQIDAGAWVHVHNCESNRGRGDMANSEQGSAERSGAESNRRGEDPQ
jgi:altronate dehydratase small subunit